MKALFLAGAVAALLAGHYLRVLRWERFIRIYERPPISVLFRSLSLGYAFNLILPVRGGDAVRTVYVGRRLKNGMGFALATVILDRLLDVAAVAVIFGVFQLAGLRDPVVTESAVLYETAAVVIASGLVLCRCFSRQIKRAAAALCSIFNDTIRLEGMKFFWSLINTFRDLRRKDFVEMFCSTLVMWAAYLSSYGLFAAAVSGEGAGGSLSGIFITLFSRSSLGLTALVSAGELGGGTGGNWMGLIYTVAPILALYAVTLLPDAFRSRLGRTAVLSSDRKEEDYLNILPQVDARDQRRFLDDYFNSSNREFIRKFIELNRGVSILRDYSAGSNATTMLCMDREATFYRKYAFGEDGEKLRDQLDWLQGHRDVIPVCEIIREDCGEGYCCYDMRYNGSAVSMFRYMHSQPAERSWMILRSLLEDLGRNLYTRNERRPGDGDIERYLTGKVDRNLKEIMDSRLLTELTGYNTLVINGQEYRNLTVLGKLFDHGYLREVFAQDRYSDIHGDLTVENIICLDNEADLSRAYYIIDPNTGNIHDSQFLDYGKLLQSLHGGYEFMMMTKSVKTEGNHVDFICTRSAVYDEMLERVKGYLHGTFSEGEVRSIFHHELVHWLRLMPYKLRNDRKRAAMFYAGLVKVANDIYEWYG